MNRKKLVAALLVIAMLVSGVAVAPKTAKAETSETIEKENGVLYILDDTNYSFKTYWKDNNKQAPVKENYVFGGWYQKAEDSDTMVALKESTAKAAVEKGERAYAKFVPADVLSIKAQNEAGVSAESTDARSIRIISSVDSTNYQKVGFDIFLNNDENRRVKATDGGDTCNTEVYQTLQNDAQDTTKYPSKEFHAASTHFSVWRVNNINCKNDSKIIYARPYWLTLDGTTVYGLAKYVHIEDEYKNYISVPINLLTGEGVAAGQVSLTYDSDVFTYVGFEAGRLLPEMYANPATAGTVSIVGNAAVGSDGTYNNVNADGIYGNVRFSVNQGQTATGQTIGMTAGAFCDWDKQDVTLSAWDVLVKPAEVVSTE